MKQQSGQPDRMTMRPWRCVMPLLGTLAVATIVTVSLPTKADVPRDKPAITVQAQTKAPETKDFTWNYIAAGAIGTVIAVGLAYCKKYFE